MNEDLDFELSSIQGERESQFTIFWLDSNIEETPKIKKENPLGKKMSINELKPPIRAIFKKSDKIGDNSASLLSPQRLLSYNENKVSPLNLRAGNNSARHNLNIIRDNNFKKMNSNEYDYNKQTNLSDDEPKSIVKPQISPSRYSCQINEFHFKSNDEIANNKEKLAINIIREEGNKLDESLSKTTKNKDKKFEKQTKNENIKEIEQINNKSTIKKKRDLFKE